MSNFSCNLGLSFYLYIQKKPSKESARSQTKPSQNGSATADMEVLGEVVNIMTSQALEVYSVSKQTALLEVDFCKNSETTDNYQITSSVFGTDGTSSYTQYLCSGPPCDPASKTLIKYEGKQLPNNNVYLTTQSGQYQHFLVYIVCWSGEFNPEVENYVGHFQYFAQIQRMN